MAYRMASDKPARKVLAGTAGGGVGGATAEILVYLIEQTGRDLPTGIETAITVLVVAAAAFAAGYLTPPAGKDHMEHVRPLEAPPPH